MNDEGDLVELVGDVIEFGPFDFMLEVGLKGLLESEIL